MINKNIVFLSYGSTTEYFRAIYCILSLASWTEHKMNRLRLIIYTDQPDFFRTYLSGFDIIYVNLTSEILLDMLAGTGFLHRRKVAVIDLTFMNYPEQDLVFIDSDTFFTAEPLLLFEPLAEGKSLMHKKEYKLSEGLKLFSSFGQGHYPEAFINYLSGREFTVKDQIMIFSAEDYSHNSGVVGLSNSFAAHMKYIFELTDAFYANSKWFISEQMAFSLLLQRTTEIVSTENFITHYWGAHQKRVIDQRISKFLSAHTELKLRDPAFMRSSTKKMQRIVDSDLLEEQLGIALNQRNFVYAAKKGIQLLFLRLFNIVIKKQ